MQTITVANLILFTSSVLILWFVVRYRIHIHVQYSRRGATAPGLNRHALSGAARATIRRVQPLRKESAAGSSTSGKAYEDPARVNVLEDLTSALMNLGCDRVKAKRIASRVSQQRGGFDDLLRVAIKEAA